MHTGIVLRAATEARSSCADREHVSQVSSQLNILYLQMLSFQECQDTDFQDPGVLVPAVCWCKHTGWQSQATGVKIGVSNRVPL